MIIDPLSISLKCSLILLAALALAAAFRRGKAARRHGLWAIALAGVLALPLLSGALPSLPMPVLPATGWMDTRPVPAAPPVAGEAPGESSRTRAAARARSGLAGGTPLQEGTGRAADRRDSLHPSGWGAAAATGLPGAGGPDAGISRSALILSVWMAGLAAFLLRLAAGVRHMRRLVRGARPLDRGHAAAQVRMLSGKLGLDRNVRLMMSRAIGSPVTWGWLRPVVLLPCSAASWSAGRLEVVLLHELIHVRRLHWPLQILAALTAAIHWFNPLVWLAGRRLQAEREMACDEGVLEHGTRPSDYATHLLEIARSLPGTGKAPAASLAVSLPFSRSPGRSRAGRSALERRLAMILKPRSVSGPGRWSALSLAGLAVAILPVAAVQLRAGPAEPAAPLVKAASREPASSGVTGTLQQVAERDGSISAMSTGHGDFTLRQTVDGVDLRVRMEDSDTVEFSRDGREIVAMGRHAEVVIRTAYEGSHQRLEISSDGDGGLTYDWTVNGDSRPFDSQAREWMHLTLEIAGNLRKAGSLQGQHSSLRGRISSIEGHVSSQKGRISSIRGRASSLKGRISSIRGHVSSLQGRISSIRGHEASLRGRIASLQGRISSLRSQKGRISDSSTPERRALVRELNADIDREIASLQEEIHQVEEELKDYDGDRLVHEVEQEIREYDAEGRIAEVEEELAGLDVEGMVREIEREIEEFDAESLIREIEEEIRSLEPLEKADEITERTERLYPELRRLVQRIR